MLRKTFAYLRSIPPKMFLRKDVLKICRKFTGEHFCRSMISVKLQRNFTEVTLRYGCSVNLLHIFRTTSPKKAAFDICLSYMNWSNFRDFDCLSFQIRCG